MATASSGEWSRGVVRNVAYTVMGSIDSTATPLGLSRTFGRPLTVPGFWYWPMVPTAVRATSSQVTPFSQRIVESSIGANREKRPPFRR